MRIFGKVKKGFGKGKYFMSLKDYQKQFYKILGYYPYKGTLNLELDLKSFVEFKKRKRKCKKYKINGFIYKNKRYRLITLIKGKSHGSKIAIVFPYYQHHGKRIIEIIAKQNLRKKFLLKNGSKFCFEI